MATGDYDRNQMKEVITDGVSRVTSTVQDALKSGDYSNLSRNVSAEMEALFSNIGRTVNIPFQQGRRNGGGYYQNGVPGQGYPNYQQFTNAQSYMNTQTYQRVRDINQRRYQAAQGIPVPMPVKTQGGYRSSALYKDMKSSKVGAAIGTFLGYGIGGMFTLFSMIGFLSEVMEGDIVSGLFGALFVFLFLAAGPLVGAIFGTKHLKKIKRFEEYQRVLGEKTYAQVDMLSKMTSKEKEFTIRELQDMIRNGWFMQGHLDENGDTLITSEETYQQYLHTLQVAAERAAQQAQEQAEREKEYGGLTEAQYEIIKQGEEYIQQIRQCNKDIPDVDVTAKLDRMVHSVEVIVERAKQQPELTEDMTRLMNYYLPTMVKLLHRYAELDSQGKSSANIEKSKKEIEDTIDVMNEAFDRLFDSLFEDTSLDIATDVEVMRTLLSQEGLTGHSFTSNQTMPGSGDEN